MGKDEIKMIFTTSWDDGNKLDLKLIKLLDKYNLKATFYIPKSCQFKSLSDRKIKEISKNYEIGAHTLTHQELSEINLKKAKSEITNSKKYLEDLLEREIKVFCYPKGRYNNRVKKITQEAGFLGARTTEEFCFQKLNDFFAIKTSLHTYPFPLRKINKNHYHWSRFLFQPLAGKLSNISKLNLPASSYFSWLNLAKNMLDYCYNREGIFHLWGHSWEIEEYGMWQDLDNFFRYITSKKNIIYLTNSEVLETESRN